MKKRKKTRKRCVLLNAFFLDRRPRVIVMLSTATRSQSSCRDDRSGGGGRLRQRFGRLRTRGRSNCGSRHTHATRSAACWVFYFYQTNQPGCLFVRSQKVYRISPPVEPAPVTRHLPWIFITHGFRHYLSSSELVRRLRNRFALPPYGLDFSYPNIEVRCTIINNTRTSSSYRIALLLLSLLSSH